MQKPGRPFIFAAAFALCMASYASASETANSLGFNSHGLPELPVQNPYATKPSCAGKMELAAAHRYLEVLRSDVAIVEESRSRIGHYPDGAFPLRRVGALSAEYVRTRAGFGFVLRFRPFSAIRPLFDCAYVSVATAAQLNRRGLPSQSPDGSPGAVFAFTTETGVYLVGEFEP